MNSRRETMMMALTGTAAFTIRTARADAGPSEGCVRTPQTPWATGFEGQRKADLGDGRYLNPILAGDFPDPSILKDGDDYYMTHSSFDAAPGLLIWHSRDLVNWTPLGTALRRAAGITIQVRYASQAARDAASHRRVSRRSAPDQA